MESGASPGLEGPGLHGKHFRDELHPHIQRDLSLLVLHVFIIAAWGLPSSWSTKGVESEDVLPAAFWGTLFQLAVSPLKLDWQGDGRCQWESRKGAECLEASHNQTVEGWAYQMEENNTVWYWRKGTCRGHPKLQSRRGMMLHPLRAREFMRARAPPSRCKRQRVYRTKKSPMC